MYKENRSANRADDIVYFHTTKCKELTLSVPTSKLMSQSYAERTTHVKVYKETRDRINQFDDLTQDETISLALDLLEESDH